jgi:hypothetical protein
MDLLTKFSDALRSIGMLHSDIEKITGSIDSASAEYHADRNQSRNQQPVILGELRRPQAEIDAEQTRETHKEQRETRQEGRDRLRLFFEASGLLIASVLAIANIGLWLVTKEVSHATRDAASAANSQVKATKESIEASISAYHLDQRAWIGISKIDGRAVLNQPFLITIFFANSGKTPARNVSVNASFDPVPKGGHPDFTLEKKIAFSNRGFIPPGAIVNIQASGTKIKGDNLNQYGANDLASGNVRFYVHGTVVYEDIFQCRHWLSYCSYLSDPSTGVYSSCSDHNDTDDANCKR